MTLVHPIVDRLWQGNADASITEALQFTEQQHHALVMVQRCTVEIRLPYRVTQSGSRKPGPVQREMSARDGQRTQQQAVDVAREQHVRQSSPGHSRLFGPHL